MCVCVCVCVCVCSIIGGSRDNSVLHPHTLNFAEVHIVVSSSQIHSWLVSTLWNIDVLG